MKTEDFVEFLRNTIKIGKPSGYNLVKMIVDLAKEKDVNCRITSHINNSPGPYSYRTPATSDTLSYSPRYTVVIDLSPGYRVGIAYINRIRIWETQGHIDFTYVAKHSEMPEAEIGRDTI